MEMQYLTFTEIRKYFVTNSATEINDMFSEFKQCSNGGLQHQQ